MAKALTAAGPVLASTSDALLGAFAAITAPAAAALAALDRATWRPTTRPWRPRYRSAG